MSETDAVDWSREPSAPAQILGDSRLNLGCGHDQPDGWTNVDVSETVDPDRVVDLNDQPWPWRGNSVERVRAQHVLEHLDDAVGTLREICRIVEPGGRLHLVYPIGHTAREDPTHEQQWSVSTAEWLGGDPRHGHELDLPLETEQTRVEWSLSQSDWLERVARACESVWGTGSWVEQLPGCYGEVQAVFRVRGESK